jgi:tetratricopeptide (TPR) repeat protein
LFFHRTKASLSLEKYSMEQVLPKSWLLKSFFNGYDTLETAFSLDRDPQLRNGAYSPQSVLEHFEMFSTDKLEPGYVPVSAITEAGAARYSATEIHDIDDDTSEMTATTMLLRDEVNSNDILFDVPGSLRIPDAFKDDTRAGYVIHSLDVEALRAVYALASLFDDEAEADETGEAVSYIDNGGDVTTLEMDFDEAEAETMFVSYAEEAVDMAELLQFGGEAMDNGFQGSSNLLAQGKLTIFVSPDSPDYIPAVFVGSGIGLKDGVFVSEEDEESKEKRYVAEAASLKHDSQIQRLIQRTDEYLTKGIHTVKKRAVDDISSVTSSSTSSTISASEPTLNSALAEVNVEKASSCAMSPPSVAFRCALRVLRSTVVQYMSGVVFNEYGCILDIRSVSPLLAVPVPEGRGDTEDEEGAWEDCDDDEEADMSQDEAELEAVVDSEEVTTVEDEILAAVSQVEESLHSLPVSYPITARLLSLCSSMAYLAGDSVGAVKCLRTAVVCIENSRILSEYRIAGTAEADRATIYEAKHKLIFNKFHVDTLIRLASLLTDMDEPRESKELFTTAELLSPQNAYIALHRAELEIHNNQFSEAIALLRKAKRLSIYSKQPTSVGGLACSNVDRSRKSLNQLQASVYSLLGVALFRQCPTRPEVNINCCLYDALRLPLSPQLALNELREGVDFLPNNIYLQMCLGEVSAQIGDAMGAIKCFERASKVDKLHPLPFVNAARTYHQLNQQAQAKRHITT